MINHNKKIIFIDITKTAGSSIRYAIKGKYRCKRHHSIRNLFSKKVFCSYLTKQQIDTYFKFTIVRNPYDRIVSLWSYMKIAKKTQFKDISFKEFVLGVKNNLYTRYNICYTPMIEWVIDNNNNIKVDFIGRFENLDEDFNKICSIINIKNKQLKKLCSSERDKEYWLYYDKETKNIVEELYKEDLERFRYKWKGGKLND